MKYYHNSHHTLFREIVFPSLRLDRDLSFWFLRRLRHTSQISSQPLQDMQDQSNRGCLDPHTGFHTQKCNMQRTFQYHTFFFGVVFIRAEMRFLYVLFSKLYITPVSIEKRIT